MFHNKNIEDTKQSCYSSNFESYRSVKGELPPHRSYCADFWEETIPLIIEMLKEHGLKPEHKLADMGCGAFRSGLSIIPYLNTGNYYGIDINQYLIEDGYELEIKDKKLDDKFPLNNIKITHDYDMTDFRVKFDYVWSFSLWTHLDLSECDKCLYEISKVINVGGIYLTTCFIVSKQNYKKEGKIVCDVTIKTHHNKDPYHHTFESFSKMGEKYNFLVEDLGIGKCCPRKHNIIKFTKFS